MVLLLNIIACGSDAGFTKETKIPEAGPYDIETPCEWESVEAHPEWERYDCNPLQSSGAWTASFAWVEGEGFRTWQVRGDYFESWELVHSTSDDGVTWSDWDVLLESVAGEWDSLLWDTIAVRPLDDGSWALTHQGIGPDWFYGIGVIESSDGLSWEPGESIVPSQSACWPLEITGPDEVFITKYSSTLSCDLFRAEKVAGEWVVEDTAHRVSEGKGFIDWGLIKEHEYAIQFSDWEERASAGHYIEWDGELLDFGLSDEVASFEAIEIGPHIYAWIQDQGETHYFRLLGE